MTVLGDTAVEPNETFQVALSAPSGLTIADGTGQVTIVNDDTAPPPPPPPPPPGSPALEQMDGGPTPYAGFANPLSSSVAFFPVAVWGSYAHEVANVAEDKAVGINTYVWVADPNASFMQNIRNAGQRVIQDHGVQANFERHAGGGGLAFGG